MTKFVFKIIGTLRKALGGFEFGGIRLTQKIRGLATRIKLKTIRQATNCRWFFYKTLKYKKTQRHNLPFKLVVSLTSFPPRFPTLALTLKTLLMQSVKPDEFVLWIAQDDFGKLDNSVLELTEFGLKIKTCKDIRSYKKLIPQLEAEPEAAVITFDDDICYDRDVVRDLVRAYASDTKEVLCLRAHKIHKDAQRGVPLPYISWEHDIVDNNPSKDIFPTGAGGIFYPPGVLHQDVISDKFRKLCPSGDDIWFYWMTLRAGATPRKVGPRRMLRPWAGTQEVSLWSSNQLSDGNDRQIRNMLEEFGVPWDLADSAPPKLEKSTYEIANRQS